jgi:hypothetical protein
MVNLKEALLNPAAVFHGPEEVVQDDRLSGQQKIEILRRWEYDARQLQVADEESMTAPLAAPVPLDAILKALRELGAPADVEHSAPTKQGGS